MLEQIKIQKIRGWRKFLLYPFVLFLKIFALTVRIKLSDRMFEFLNTHKNSAIIAFWHQNLFLIWKINKMLQTTLPMYGLVSPSSDGAWLSAFFDLFNIKSVRGSSGRRGTSALHELQLKLQEGANVAITPDGPRGPVKKFKPGVPALALRSKTNIVLLSIKHSSFWKLNTWDKFIIPKPFSTLTIDCKKLLYKDFQSLSILELKSMLERELQALQSTT